MRKARRTAVVLGPSLIALAACAGQPVASPPENVTPLRVAAMLGLAGVSASHNASTASFAIDGNLATNWDSTATSNPWLTARLASPSTLSELQLKMNPNVGTYDVAVSTDGATWRTVLSAQRNTTWTLETKPLPAGTTASQVRLTFINGGAKVMAFELRLNSPTGTSPVPSIAPSIAPSTAPSTAPTVAPSLAPTAPPAAGATLSVDRARVLHAATSHVLGANRNHVAGAFPNGPAKLAKMQELTPSWAERKYLYRIGHGPTDGRWDYSYLTGYHFEKTWNKDSPYPYDDIRNALREAEALGADQFHVVNFGTSDAAEAARYVSYLNRAGDANRALYPIAQQNVREFELGNEISWSMVRGHSQYAPNETAYATRAREFARAMRAASDVPIKIGAVAGTNSNWLGNGWSGGGTTVRNILTTMGDQVDFLTYHGYPSWPVHKPGDRRTLMAQNEWNRQLIENTIKPAIRQYAGGRDVYIANSEFYSLKDVDATTARGMFGALYSADTLTLAFNQDIRTAVQFCLDHGRNADSSFFLSDDPNNTSAIFKLQKLLAEHWGDQIVATSSTGVPTLVVAGAKGSVTVPRLAYTASVRGAKTFLMVTNRFDDQDVSCRVDLGFSPRAVSAYELAGPSGWQSANGEVKVLTTPSLAGYVFKRASVTIFEIDG